MRLSFAPLASLRLFVYGSLRRGGQHHEELRGSRFLGEARTTPGFALTTLGPYWALVPAPGQASSVPGELFDVTEDLLLALDEFEGDGYERGEVPLAASENHPRGQPSSALAYFKKSR